MQKAGFYDFRLFVYYNMSYMLIFCIKMFINRQNKINSLKYYKKP